MCANSLCRVRGAIQHDERHGQRICILFRHGNLAIATCENVLPRRFLLPRKRIEKLRYMHRNPVKRGLVERPEDWA